MNVGFSTERGAQGRVPSLAEGMKTWTEIGILSFGGPTAQIALMHRIIVVQKKWLSEEQFLGALSFCMLLPGPEAMQLATYAGWRMHGVLGGLAAGLLFVLPGAAVVLAMSAFYAVFGNVAIVEALFTGVKAAVLVIVVEALLRISKRALARPEYWIVAGISFVAIFFLGCPFPLIVLGAALFGFFRSTPAPTGGYQAKIDVKVEETLYTAVGWLAIWLAPLIMLTVVFGPSNLFSEIGWFFSKLAVVTFGGAYAVLAYMAQDVVMAFGWLDAGQMMDGLGLAETTPGPLILVTEFVGYIAAFQHGGKPPWLMGLFGALVALWATFAPCFLWIFVGAPYIEWISARPRLKGALSGITAAVVGVILNLAVWFGLHVLFHEIEQQSWGPLQLWVPHLVSLDWRVIVLAVISGILLLWRHWSIPGVLTAAASLSLLSHLVSA